MRVRSSIAGVALLIAAVASAPLGRAQAPPAEPTLAETAIRDIDTLIEGVGFDLLVVAQKWGLVPRFCVSFSSSVEEQFADRNELSQAFEAAQNRLSARHAWYDPWGHVQRGMLSILYYFGWSSSWFFSDFSLQLTELDIYILPLPSVYLTLKPLRQEFSYADEGPGVLYQYLSELGYEVVKVAEVIGVTGPSVTILFRTRQRPEPQRQWAWAKINNYIDSYPDQWSITYFTLTSLTYLLRQADESMRYFGDEPSMDLDYVALEVGLFPAITNRVSLADNPPAEFRRDPCQ